MWEREVTSPRLSHVFHLDADADPHGYFVYDARDFLSTKDGMRQDARSFPYFFVSPTANTQFL